MWLCWLSTLLWLSILFRLLLWGALVFVFFAVFLSRRVERDETPHICCGVGQRVVFRFSDLIPQASRQPTENARISRVAVGPKSYHTNKRRQYQVQPLS